MKKYNYLFFIGVLIFFLFVFTSLTAAEGFAGSSYNESVKKKCDKASDTLIQQISSELLDLDVKSFATFLKNSFSATTIRDNINMKKIGYPEDSDSKSIAKYVQEVGSAVNAYVKDVINSGKYNVKEQMEQAITGRVISGTNGALTTLQNENLL